MNRTRTHHPNPTQLILTQPNVSTTWCVVVSLVDPIQPPVHLLQPTPTPTEPNQNQPDPNHPGPAQPIPTHPNSTSNAYSVRLAFFCIFRSFLFAGDDGRPHRPSQLRADLVQVRYLLAAGLTRRLGVIPVWHCTPSSEAFHELWIRRALVPGESFFYPYRTSVPFWGQSTQLSSSLSPKRDGGPERVKGCASNARTQHVELVGSDLGRECVRTAQHPDGETLGAPGACMCGSKKGKHGGPAYRINADFFRHNRVFSSF